MKNDFVATGIVFNQDITKVLLVWHRKLNRWLPPGGHLEMNELPHLGAIREVLEETNVDAVIWEQPNQIATNNAYEIVLPNPYVILHEVIASTSKEAEHMHIDFIYLLQASEDNAITINDEVEKGKWFLKEEILSSNTFDSIKQICSRVMN
ncbi:NUDIX domain-containing protein [Paenibacillus sp. 1011MAR3C5]|uniref:NUDIX hydrolase n=1 Tax=Paenibacillus sp. 1011MAR3C5 TaxID=1675787 RepID=UPI000E6CA49D|nr:NUDIX domain-containing protein [Paenibacillus sp. 1011MAR3C5]RJE89667.1 NUDIX domain-containing protein [Paenibacillus sp. 1011MAR3C5]